jgi:malate dehydrogenase (oxaloacetate-decarboxylating)
MATVSPDRYGAGGVLEVGLSGYELLANPLLNKGTAFTDHERHEFGLHGLLPPLISSLEDQIERRMTALRYLPSDLERYVFLRELQDTNETLFYAVLTGHLEELLPIVYTPTVGLGCEHFSRLYRRPRGVFLSITIRERMREILANPHFDEVESIVVTDGERILGLGDQGAGGMGIPIGKLALYTACAGIHPARTLPILLDVGTDNEERRRDPLYIGWHHPRVRGEAYDSFIEEFIEAVIERWPGVLLQWEDFAGTNASRLLARYRSRLCTFNDDIQGTAAITVGTLLAALRITGTPLSEQRICIMGAGGAGCGIASLMVTALCDAGLSEREALNHLYLVDRDGLLIEGMNGAQDFQQPFLRARADVSTWRIEGTGARWPWQQRYRPGRFIGLKDTIVNGRITALIGVTGKAGLFDEGVVRAMAAHNARPVIFPLSNPTSHAEATPADITAWSEGRAIIGVGSPFPPLLRNGKHVPVDQINNTYVFPGLALGVIVSGARFISDGMILTAAKSVAALSPTRNDPQASLLPPIGALREVALEVATAVALQAQKEGHAPARGGDIREAIRARMWTPAYVPYRRAGLITAVTENC